MNENPDIRTWDPRARYKQRHRDKGLCTECSRPVVPGKRHCEVHARLVRERSKAKYEKRKKLGLCVACGKPLDEFEGKFVVHTRSECKPSRRTRP